MFVNSIIYIKSMFRGSMIYSWSEKEETVENMISEVNLEFS